MPLFISLSAYNSFVLNVRGWSRKSSSSRFFSLSRHFVLLFRLPSLHHLFTVRKGPNVLSQWPRKGGRPLYSVGNVLTCRARNLFLSRFNVLMSWRNFDGRCQIARTFFFKNVTSFAEIHINCFGSKILFLSRLSVLMSCRKRNSQSQVAETVNLFCPWSPPKNLFCWKYQLRIRFLKIK